MSFENIKYEINKEKPQHVVDEKGNKYLQLAWTRWNDRGEYKLELRSFYSTNDGYHPGKGVSFLTEDGPNELVKCMVEDGYGDDDELFDVIVNNRSNLYAKFANHFMNKDENEIKDIIDNNYEDESDDEFYDAEDLLG